MILDLGSGMSPEEIEGCQDTSACNYMEMQQILLIVFSEDVRVARRTDGSGVIVYNDDDEDGYCNIGSGISPEEIEGCQDVSACNYMEAATDPSDCNLRGCESCSGEQMVVVIVYNADDEDGYCNIGSGMFQKK